MHDVAVLSVETAAAMNGGDFRGPRVSVVVFHRSTANER